MTTLNATRETDQDTHMRPDLTLGRTCEVLSIGPTKARSLIKDGVLEAYKLGPDRRSGLRIRWESVEALRNSQVSA